MRAMCLPSPTALRRRGGPLLALLLASVLGACGAAPPATGPAPAPTALPPVQPPPPAGAELPFPLTVPPGYRVSLYASGLREVRSVVFSPDGVPYVTVMNRDIRGGGQILALPDADADGQADTVVVAAEGLDRPHGIAWHEGVLYASEAATLYRFFDDNGDLVTDRREPIVTGMPADGDHWSRPFVFDAEGMLLVAIGSSCNVCQEGDKQRATFLRFDPTKVTEYPGDTVFARGLRSVVGMTYRPGTQELWVTNNARDYLGPDAPPDQLFRVERDGHYGWPYCYGARVPDPEAIESGSIRTPDRSPIESFCATQVQPPALLLPAHVAPLGLTFYSGEQFPAEMRGRLFVAYHGAFDRSNAFGYRVVSVPFAADGTPGQPEDFVTGFLLNIDQPWLGRPVDVAVGPEGSLYITDDVNGYLFRVDYVGQN